MSLFVGRMKVEHSGLFVWPFVPVQVAHPGEQPCLWFSQGCPFISGRPKPAAHPFGLAQLHPLFPTCADLDAGGHAPPRNSVRFPSRALRGKGLVIDACEETPATSAAASTRRSMTGCSRTEPVG